METHMHTQKSSKQRIRKDTVGDEGLKKLFENYETLSLIDFRTACTETIEQSSGKRETKDKFIYEIETTTSKNVMLMKVTNYLLAGQGFGV